MPISILLIGQKIIVHDTKKIIVTEFGGIEPFLYLCTVKKMTEQKIEYSEFSVRLIQWFQKVRYSKGGCQSRN